MLTYFPSRTDADILQAVIRSGELTLFTKMPPSAADTRFITNLVKTPVSDAGVHQLALRAFGPVDLLPSAFTERVRHCCPFRLVYDTQPASQVPNAYDDEDDIVCVGMHFGKCLGRQRYDVKAHRVLAVSNVCAS